MDLRHQSSAMCIIMLGGELNHQKLIAINWKHSESKNQLILIAYYEN